MFLIVTSQNKNSFWISGKIVPAGYTFSAKVYDLPSAFGIEGGRVSKLDVRTRHGKIVFSYERGWDKQPTSLRQNLILRLILNRFPDP